MGLRRRAAEVLALVTAGMVLALLPRLGWAATVPLGVGGAGVAFVAVTRSTRTTLIHTIAIATAVPSLVATVAVLREPFRSNPPLEWWGMVETALLIALVAMSVRWGRGPLGVTAVVLTVLAQTLWILRIVPERTPGALAVAALLWSAGSWVATFVGGYPRYAAHRLRRTVTAARTQQRRQLERDLHDYVAHDVSGILVQAQAAQFAANDDPEVMRRLLARIERSAHNALSAMDRAMELLRDDEAASSTSPARHHPDLHDLPRVVAAFSAATSASVNCRIELDPDDVAPRASVIAHRVAVEALTNVRRHAPMSSWVSVMVASEDDGSLVGLVVENHASADFATPLRVRPGGTGLARAHDLVRELGGTFAAGPSSAGWRVSARLPVTPESG